jgi:hypothetical protein
MIIVLTSPVIAGLIGDFYQNERYGCSLSGNGWNADANQRKKLVVFKGDDGISEVSLDVLPMSQYSASTAKQVAQGRVEGYDSWMYIGGRQMEGWEISNANASDGYLVMYSKNVFSRTSGAIKILVTEKYYIKNGYVYVVSILSSSQTWSSAKDNLLRIAGSFKLS